MNRKAAVYTIVSIVLVFVVASLFFIQNHRTAQEAHAVISERVRTMDNFINNIARDSERAAYIAGFRTLIAMEQEVTSSGNYFVDADSAFLEIFYTGNFSGNSYDVMTNSTFSQYVDRVAQMAGEQGLILSLNVSNTSLWQEDPWYLQVNFTFDIELNDSRDTASWITQVNVTGAVPILEIRDPLFTKNTLARVQRVIIKTNVTEFVDDAGDKNDTHGIMTHFNNSWYTAQGRGPNIIMRFEGNLSDNMYGIESLVDTVEILDQVLPVNTTNSVVDYKYFGDGDADACNIQNVPTYLKLATEDLDIYEIEGELEYSAC